MASAFIFHGTGGYPEENWFPWLKEKLESEGWEVFVPQFPTPHEQTLENWFGVLEEYEKKLTPESILIGHSLGGAFLLRVLERSFVKFKAALLVAAPVGVLPIKNYDSDKRFLGEFVFDWPRIKGNCKSFFVFHSDNDPYVSLGNGKTLSEKLGTELIFVPNSGHFNKAADFTKFELLFEKIKSVG